MQEAQQVTAEVSIKLFGPLQMTTVGAAEDLCSGYLVWAIGALFQHTASIKEAAEGYGPYWVAEVLRWQKNGRMVFAARMRYSLLLLLLDTTTDGALRSYALCRAQGLAQVPSGVKHSSSATPLLPAGSRSSSFPPD